METTPAIQDYLGAIYDLTGGDKPVIGARLARHMHVSAPSITESLRRMRRKRYVRLAGRKEIRLTTKGKGMAERNMKAAQRMQEQQAEYIRSVGGGGADPAEQISKAKGLLDSGAITQAEFDSLKAKALA